MPRILQLVNFHMNARKLNNKIGRFYKHKKMIVILETVLDLVF